MSEIIVNQSKLPAAVVGCVTFSGL